MRGREGYIRIYRQLLDWEWYSDPNTLRLWLHILLNANWKQGRFKGREIRRGQLVTTIRGLADELKLTPMQVRTALQHLIKTNEILTNSITNRYTVITVEKYGLYQVEKSDGNKPDNKPITNQQQTNNTDIRKEEGNIENKDIITTITLLDALGGGDLDRLLDQIYADDHLDFMDLLSDIDASEIAKPYQYALTVAKNYGFIKGR